MDILTYTVIRFIVVESQYERKFKMDKIWIIIIAVFGCALLARCVQPSPSTNNVPPSPTSTETNETTYSQPTVAINWNCNKEMAKWIDTTKTIYAYIDAGVKARQANDTLGFGTNIYAAKQLLDSNRAPINCDNDASNVNNLIDGAILRMYKALEADKEGRFVNGVEDINKAADRIELSLQYFNDMK